MSVKRLTNELGTNYYVIKYDILRDGFEIPKIIRYYKTTDNYIDFDITDYPFKRPHILNSNFLNFTHEHFSIMQRNSNSFYKYRRTSCIGDNNPQSEMHDNNCFYCRSIFSCDTIWSPSYSFYYIFKQIGLLTTFISSAVKLEVIKRNYLRFPEDVIHYIITFLSIPINEIFEITPQYITRLKGVIII